VRISTDFQGSRHRKSVIQLRNFKIDGAIYGKSIIWSPKKEKTMHLHSSPPVYPPKLFENWMTPSSPPE